jgi:hypothetical protein
MSEYSCSIHIVLVGYKGTRARLSFARHRAFLGVVQPRNKYDKVLGHLFEPFVKERRDSVNRPLGNRLVTFVFISDQGRGKGVGCFEIVTILLRKNAARKLDGERTSLPGQHP